MGPTGLQQPYLGGAAASDGSLGGVGPVLVVVLVGDLSGGNGSGLSGSSGVVLVGADVGGQVHRLTLGVDNLSLAQRHGQGLVTGDLGDEGRDLPGLLGALEELGGLAAPDIYSGFARKLITWFTTRTGEGDLFENYEIGRASCRERV